jgi:acylphosphatase
VAGYVKNLPTGEVELVAEGEPDQVDGFLAAVAQRMAGHIRDARQTEEPPAGYQDFDVRH